MAEVNFGEILSLGRLGRIPLEAVPEEERGNFRFWRAASLVKIALNFDAGKTSLNVGQNNTIFFFDDHGQTDAYRDALLWGDLFVNTQVSDHDMRVLERKAGHSLIRRDMPRIVFALDTSFNDLELPGMRGGVSEVGVNLNRTIDIADVDPYSREMIESIL